jgi:hypothetical protein
MHALGVKASMHINVRGHRDNASIRAEDKPKDRMGAGYSNDCAIRSVRGLETLCFGDLHVFAGANFRLYDCPPWYRHERLPTFLS